MKIKAKGGSWAGLLVPLILHFKRWIPDKARDGFTNTKSPSEECLSNSKSVGELLPLGPPEIPAARLKEKQKKGGPQISSCPPFFPNVYRSRYENWAHLSLRLQTGRSDWVDREMGPLMLLVSARDSPLLLHGGNGEREEASLWTVITAQPPQKLVSYFYCSCTLSHTCTSNMNRNGNWLTDWLGKMRSHELDIRRSEERGGMTSSKLRYSRLLGGIIRVCFEMPWEHVPNVFEAWKRRVF